ncbi:MAG TPA: RNA pseudouridine synthase [Myxococcales bacterium]|nr:RNA pseudouridine synthase [Myxococcales bacterium]
MNKPAGLLVDEEVVPLAARALAPPGGRAWPRVVHRLDKGTSGCLIFALRKASEQALLQAFDEGLVSKTYLALVQGKPPSRASLDTPYGPEARDKRRFTTKLSTPRRARLSYEVVERFSNAAFLRVKLDTGRTHQIRVQLAESGYPVLGDETYGVPFAGLSRQGLHAFRISLPPDVACEAPLPEDLTAVIEKLRRATAEACPKSSS